jgi:hypothetical protein
MNTLEYRRKMEKRLKELLDMDTEELDVELHSWTIKEMKEMISYIRERKCGNAMSKG